MQTPYSKTFDNLPEEKQRSIFSAALDEFSRHGFHGASINTIVRTLGIAKGSLFKYFGNKEGLFAYVFEECIRNFKGPLKQIRQSGEGLDFFQRIELTFIAGARFLEANPKAYAIYLKLLYHEDIPGRDLFLAEVRIYSRKFLLPIIMDAQNSGQLRADINPDMTVFLIEGLIDRFLQSLAVPALDGGIGIHRSSPEQYKKNIQQIIDILQNGLAADRRKDAHSDEI